MLCRVSLVLFLCISACSLAQQTELSYDRLNTFTGFFEYSNDSTHIILGRALNRKIGAIGFQYQRRLIRRKLLDFYYQAEIRPAMLESDPAARFTIAQTAPTPASYSVSGATPVEECVAGSSAPFTNPLTGTTTYYRVECTRRTAVEQGFSPGGIRVNLMPRYRLQLTFSSNAGYIFSTQAVPVDSAGSFNFCFEFGGGLEFYRTPRQSVRVEYQVQHFSNKNTASANPGVDSGFVRLAYAFGR